MTGPRIIPARAGFTAGRAPVVGRPPDHPRSRGVYFCAPRLFSMIAGSSPLARGLLNIDRAKIPTRRIIPARAGFTFT